MQNMSLMKSIISKAFFTISVIILLCLSSIAQNGLQVSARLIVKKGDLQGSKVTVTQNGNVVQTISVSNKGVFDFILEYNSEYIIVLKTWLYH